MLHLRVYIFWNRENGKKENGFRFARATPSFLPFSKIYSDFKLFTGFINAALMA